jgi:hypothetical protein
MRPASVRAPGAERTLSRTTQYGSSEMEDGEARKGEAGDG